MTIQPDALNPDFARFCNESREDREAVYTAVAEGRKASAVAIEKDFFVCRVLDALFHGFKYTPQLYFKGGTSLSKGYDLIKRFSEDIDIVISAPDLGFADEKDPANPDITSSMQKKVLSTSNAEALPQKLKAYTTGDMLAGLTELLPDCKVSEEKTPDPYGAALKVVYETALGEDKALDGYMSRTVLIESGARSARDPSDKCDVTAYIHDALGAKDWSLKSNGITVIKPERTFWDKIYILDRMCRDQDAGKLKLDGGDRKSRHHYDVVQIMDTDVGKGAIKDAELAEKVRVAFGAPDDAKPGALRLVPADNALKLLRQDYERGTSLMIFGDAPKFDQIVEGLRKLEAAINGK
jgi:hypothetical protein